MTDISQILIFSWTIQEDFTTNEEVFSRKSLNGTKEGNTIIFEAVQNSVVKCRGFDKCFCIEKTGTEIWFSGLIK